MNKIVFVWLSFFLTFQANAGNELFFGNWAYVGSTCKSGSKPTTQTDYKIGDEISFSPPNHSTKNNSTFLSGNQNCVQIYDPIIFGTWVNGANQNIIKLRSEGNLDAIRSTFYCDGKVLFHHIVSEGPKYSYEFISDSILLLTGYSNGVPCPKGDYTTYQFRRIK